VTLTALLVAPDAAAGDGLLVHSGGVDFDRDTVAGLTRQIGDALRDLGVSPAMPVAVMLPNGVGVVAALFGVWDAGGVYVPLNPRSTEVERAKVIALIDPAAIITTTELVDIAVGLPTVTLDGTRVATIQNGADGRQRGTPMPNGVALVQFTSGTTGDPKPVKLTHDGVLELLDGVIDKLQGGKPRDTSKPPMPNLVPVSMSLWAGIYQVLFALRVGAPVITMDGFDPAEFHRLIVRFDIRSTVLPPAAMTALCDDPAITDLTPLRFVRSISSPLSPLQARRFRDLFGIAVLNSYGQTEIGGEIVGWNAADSREFGDAKLGSVGRAHRGVEIRAVDAEGGTLPAGEEGELWVRTPAMGEANAAELADRLSPDGWFRTGDIGRVDDDEFVWIDGRVSDMINRGGLKVHPGEVEEVLRLSPDVADVAVAGTPDDRLGEVPWAFIVPTPGRAVDANALEAMCREHVAAYKVPTRFIPVDELPRNEVGKVLKRVLVDRALVPGATQ
jgi:long-chain acyl-CoA synthetase